MRIAIVGAGGFLGKPLVERCTELGWDVIAATRDGQQIPGASRCVSTGDLADGQFEGAFDNVDTVVNCAARVHVLRPENAGEAERRYDLVNRQGALSLAQEARRAGVSRFVQISSVAAISSISSSGMVINDDTAPNPRTPYGRSKLAADRELAGLDGDAFSVISLRFPVVYGPKAAAWFGALVKAAKFGVPLPLGSVRNQRSFIYVGNAVGAVACAAASNVSGQYIVTDGAPLSTRELYAHLLSAYGRSPIGFSLPPRLVRFGASLVLGKRASSLVGDAAYDGGRFRDDFKWEPEFSLRDGIDATVKDPSG